VLHPYYKSNYIKMAWGGQEEQDAEICGGNPDAKNWQQEAEQIVEATVRDRHESLEPMGICELNCGNTHEYVDPWLLMMPFPWINAGPGIALRVHS
jgi:hypothetical protein